MLKDAVTGKPVTRLPARNHEELQTVLARLRPEQIEAMERQIRGWANGTGDNRTDFFASSENRDG